MNDITVTPERPTRWLRSSCPDCLDIVSTIIQPIAGNNGTGDVFVDWVRCAGCERVHYGLLATPTRTRVEREPMGSPVEAQPRNAGEDSRVYTPDF